MARRDVPRRRPSPDAVHVGPGDDGRPHLAVLLPQLPEGTRPAVLLLHPGELLPAADRVQRLLPVGRRQTEQRPLQRDRRVRHVRREHRPLHRGHRRRRCLPRPASGARHGDPRVHPGGLPGPGRRLPAQLPLPGRKSRPPGEEVHHPRRQRAERGGDLLRPALRDRCARLPAELGDALTAVLPAGVHQADAGDDLPGVHRLLPRAARADPLRGWSPARRASSRASTRS